MDIPVCSQGKREEKRRELQWNIGSHNYRGNVTVRFVPAWCHVLLMDVCSFLGSLLYSVPLHSTLPTCHVLVLGCKKRVRKEQRARWNEKYKHLSTEKGSEEWKRKAIPSCIRVKVWYCFMDKESEPEFLITVLVLFQQELFALSDS